MTREDAVNFLRSILLSGLFGADEEDMLVDIIDAICYDEFEPCHDCAPCCDGCPYLE